MVGLPANYWRLWTSSAASNLSDGIFFIALPLMAVRLTDSPVLVAGIGVASRLPWLVFVLVAGALADRLDRRITMRNVQVFRVLVVGGLGVLAVSGGLSLPVLYLAAFVLGIVETLFDTAAQSILPSLVDRDDLSKANGRLYAVELVMNAFVGPPLGGLLMAVSVGLTLGGSAFGYLLAAISLTLISGSFRPQRSGAHTRITADIAEGLRYLVRHRLLRTLAVMVGVMNLASAATQAIMVLYLVAPGPVGLSELGFGVIITTFALGSLAGSLLAERVERRVGRQAILLGAIVVGSVSMAVPGLTANPFAVGASFAIGGAFIVLWNVITVSLRQRIVPDALLGRVNSAYRLFAWGTQPLGALLGGVLAQLLGLQVVFLVAGAVSLSLILLRGAIREPEIARAEAEAVSAASMAAGASASGTQAGSQRTTPGG
jgi:MFS family permease